MCKHAWYGNYDAMQLIQIKRNRNPDTHIYGSSCFTTRQIKCWLAWQRQGIGELLKIKWSGVTIFGNTHILHMLCIRWYANYHVIIWCEMLTGIWMSYSDSTHFSEQLSYKIRFIPSYGLKVMDLASLTPLQQFSENRENGGTFLTGGEPVWVADRGTGAELTGSGPLRWHSMCWRAEPTCQIGKIDQKGVALFATNGIRTWAAPGGIKERTSGAMKRIVID
jgi:hypothetical protein